jgi:hypothetical protein
MSAITSALAWRASALILRAGIAVSTGVSSRQFASTNNWDVIGMLLAIDVWGDSTDSPQQMRRQPALHLLGIVWWYK